MTKNISVRLTIKGYCEPSDERLALLSQKIDKMLTEFSDEKEESGDNYDIKDYDLTVDCF